MTALVRGRLGGAAAASAFAAASIVMAAPAPQIPGVAARDTSGIPFSCGEDQRLNNDLPTVWPYVALAGDARQFAPCPMLGPNPAHPENHREKREMQVIYRASRSADIELRRVAAQARARLRFPAEAAFSDISPLVRLESIYSFLTYSPDSEIAALRSQLLPTAKKPVFVDHTYDTLLQGLAAPADLDVRDAMLDAMGQATYYDEAPGISGLWSRDRAENTLVSYAVNADPRLSYAGMRGLEALVRVDRKRTVLAKTVESIRSVAVRTSGGEEYTARARRLAMLALTTLGDGHIETVQKAAADADWQVRRLAVARIDLAEAKFIPTIAQMLDDEAFQVRYELVGVEARHAARTHSCKALLRRFKDESLIVALRAAELVPDECEDEADVVGVLKEWTEPIERAEATNWHKPVRALTALGRIDKDTAAPLLPVAAGHPVWQVRAAAADLAGRLDDRKTLETLAADPAPNVRAAVLLALGSQKNDMLYRTAIEALRSDEFQLVVVAASALKLAPDDIRDDAVRALLNSFVRLTELKSDLTRDPRVAILERLDELLPDSRVAELMPMINDVDVLVRRTARAIYMRKMNTDVPPASTPLHRYPLQPAPDEFNNLPASAVIYMEGGGRIEIALFSKVAPVMIARFAALVRSGFYNGLTFHRVMPNFIVQGGSPTANDYGGVSRFMRDELSFRSHVRGAFGMSNRGPDAGDGQFFIDLVDLPQLDHRFTVFGQVTSGLDVLDRMLEGAKIQAISVK